MDIIKWIKTPIGGLVMLAIVASMVVLFGSGITGIAIIFIAVGVIWALQSRRRK